MTGVLAVLFAVCVLLLIVSSVLAHSAPDSTPGASGPDPSSSLNAASLEEGGAACGDWSARDVIGVIGVAIAAGICAIAFIVLFCLLAAIG